MKHMLKNFNAKIPKLNMEIVSGHGQIPQQFFGTPCAHAVLCELTPDGIVCRNDWGEEPFMVPLEDVTDLEVLTERSDVVIKNGWGEKMFSPPMQSHGIFQDNPEV